MSKEISRREFLKKVGVLAAAVSGSVLFGGYYEGGTNSADSGLALEGKSGEEVKNNTEIVSLSEDTLGTRLLTENQEGEIASRNLTEFTQEEKKGPYLVWRLPLSSVEGCEEVRKYRTYKVFSEDEFGPHSCNVRAEIFYADWAGEGKGAWRVFVTGGNPSPGEWCSVLIADCDSQNSAKAVLEKLTEGGCPEGAFWCTNINDCVRNDGEVNISSIQTCKEIEDICCRKQE